MLRLKLSIFKLLLKMNDLKLAPLRSFKNWSYFAPLKKSLLKNWSSFAPKTNSSSTGRNTKHAYLEPANYCLVCITPVAWKTS